MGLLPWVDRKQRFRKCIVPDYIDYIDILSVGCSQIRTDPAIISAVLRHKTRTKTRTKDKHAYFRLLPRG